MSTARGALGGGPTAKLEVAMVRSNSDAETARDNRVFFCNVSSMGSSSQSVSIHNQMYEMLTYPLVFPEGVGGFFTKFKNGPAVMSTEGTVLTLHDYVKAMLFQREHLGVLGRVGQEWVLAQHSRYMQNTLKFEQAILAQRRQVRRKDVEAADGDGAEQVEMQGEGVRVTLPASVPGSQGCVRGVFFILRP